MKKIGQENKETTTHPWTASTKGRRRSLVCSKKIGRKGPDAVRRSIHSRNYKEGPLIHIARMHQHSISSAMLQTGRRLKRELQRGTRQTLGLYDRASRRLLMNETNRCTVNYQFLLLAQQLYMFQAVFLPIIRSVISRTTALVQFHALHPVPDSSWSPSCVKLYQSRCTADNAPDDRQNNCPKRVELLCH